MKPTICDCGHAPTPRAPESCATGYGRDAHGRTSCYACCNDQERVAFEAARHYTAYLSGDGKSITTWPGGVLARVGRLWKVRNNFAGYLYRIQAVVDATGAQWYGTSSGPGMYCRLHRSKAV